MLVYLYTDVILYRVRQGETGNPDSAVGSRYAAAICPELVRASIGNGRSGHSSSAWPSAHGVLPAGKRTRWEDHVAAERRCPHSPCIRSVRRQRAIRLPIPRKHRSWYRQRVRKRTQDKWAGWEDFHGS